MKKIKRTVRLILSFLMVISLFSVTFVSAETEEYINLNDVNMECETNDYYFYMPEYFKSEENPSYDATVGLDSCRPFVYWWQGSYAPDDMGYCVTEEVYPNIYKAEVPKDVERLMWSNGILDDEKKIRTQTAYTSYEEEGCSYYLFHQKGIETTDGMIFVIHKESNPNSMVYVSGRLGEWFYYYGEGKYGPAPTLEEAGEEVYQNGEFPDYSLKSSIDKVIVEKGQSVTFTTNYHNYSYILNKPDETIATATSNYKESIFTVTGVEAGETKVVLEALYHSFDEES